MTLPGQVVWKRRPPRRAIARLGWVTAAATVGLAIGGLLFGDEPEQGDGGSVNPLALVVPALGLFFGVLALPGLVGLVRRPIVAADHYALTMRPGCGRTLVLPWSQLVELAAIPVRDQPVLLIRCGRRRGATEWPRWWDQGVLRAVRRAGGGRVVAAYDLAVMMRDFAGHPVVLFDSLVALAPAHLNVISKL